MTNKSFDGDRPIEISGQDRLGFSASAKHVALGVQHFSSPEGFVIGLEGAWGSGKSSFINLVIDEFSRLAPPPEIVKFSPWLISSRDTLLDQLFSEIIKAVSKIGANSSKKGKKKKENSAIFKKDQSKRIAEKLSSFSNQLSAAGKVALFAEAFGVPFAGMASRALEAAGDAGKQRAAIVPIASLEEQKEAIKNELRAFPRKIVIFIDDLDRLEPAEAGEVVRLVRAVADFPNVIYVLSYSREILTKSLKKAFLLDDVGDDYIEKIVQVTFSIPRPEDFDLRRMLREDVEGMFSQRNAEINPMEVNDRQKAIAEVIDFEGGRTLRVPRDVVRVGNALRLYAGPLIDAVDLADMVWLQLVRVRNHKLYEWIEKYINNVAAVAGGARISSSGSKRIFNDLIKILEEENDLNDDRFWHLQRILPGISYSGKKEDIGLGWAIFSNVSQDGLSRWVLDKRLGSPQHFRLYFAFSKPASALEDREFEKFINDAIKNIPDARHSFRELSKKTRPQGGVFSDAVLGRLIGDGFDQIDKKAIPGILLSIADGMDIAARVSGTGDWGKYWIWDTADNAFSAGFKKISQKDRLKLIKKIFSEGEAISWLSSIIRDETFAHGRWGDRAKPENERIFTSKEFDEIIKIMTGRYKKADPEEMLQAVDLTTLLFAWEQSSSTGRKEARRWVSRLIKDDDKMLTFLDKMRGWQSSNGVISHPIRTQILNVFCDVKKIRSRLQKLTKKSGFGARAKKLLLAFDDER
jgi:hypothetical protein